MTTTHTCLLAMLFGLGVLSPGCVGPPGEAPKRGEISQPIPEPPGEEARRHPVAPPIGPLPVARPAALDPARDMGTETPMMSLPPAEEAAPSDDSERGENEAKDELCLEGPNKGQTKVYYGTDRPRHVPLSPGQVMAVGTFHHCSGALVAPRWVLTASHCELSRRDEFCVGEGPRDRNRCADARRVFDNPSSDMCLVELDRDLRELLPELEPIPLLGEALDHSWIGRTAEAAGYGQDEHGGYGTREFTAQPIVRLSGDRLTIDGEGERGVCFGDSGGPVMVISSDGSVRVAGNLADGDGSCMGQDNYTRVDTYRGWIEEHMGPLLPPGPQPCGNVDSVGTCSADGRSVRYCEQGLLQVSRCEASETCGWAGEWRGWRCISPEEDPCQGVTTFGQCEGETLRWCDRGQLLSRDCGACNERCLNGGQQLGYICQPSDCGDLDYTGRCQGAIAEWCKEGQRELRDCAAEGLICDYVDDETGYYCMDPDDCGALDYIGRCVGDTLEWCDDGRRERNPCDNGERCTYLNDEVGYNCSDCGELDFIGRCDGDVAVWCNRRGRLEALDCRDHDQRCGLVDEETGFHCVDLPPRPVPDNGGRGADADEDGIEDHLDRCSDTEPGEEVWLEGPWAGCAWGQYRDSDR